MEVGGEPAPGGAGRRLVAFGERHPLVVVGLVGVVVVLHHLWIIHRDRHLGTFDLDEAGYLAQAMRMQRMVAAHGPTGVWDVLPTETGPLLPLLSVGPLLALPASAQAAMAVQPVLAAVTAVGVAGITRRVAGAIPAIVAGLVALGLPAMLVAARGYQPSVATSCALVLAVWALLASEGAERRGPIIAFGLAVGALVLARTMAVAFVPGLALAVAIELPRTAAALRRLALALGAAVLVAGPWWIEHGATAWRYLTGNGYSGVAQQYGPTSPFIRVGSRLVDVVLGVRLLLLVPAVALWATAASLVWRRWRAGVLRQPISPRSQHLVAVWGVVAWGYLALLSTANQGVAFDLPLLLLGVAGTASLIRYVPLRRRPLLGWSAAGAAVLNLVAIGHVGWGDGVTLHHDGRPVVSASEVLFAGQQVAESDLAEADDRFALGASAVRRSEAAEAWWRAAVEVVWALDRIEAETPGGAVRTATGSSPLLSANTILLAEEIASEGQRPLTEVDAAEPDDAFGRLTQRTRDGHRNVLIIIEAQDVPQADQRRFAAQRAEAVLQGWVVRDEIALPDGGRVSLLVHP